MRDGAAAAGQIREYLLGRSAGLRHSCKRLYGQTIIPGVYPPQPPSLKGASSLFLLTMSRLGQAQL